MAERASTLYVPNIPGIILPGRHVAPQNGETNGSATNGNSTGSHMSATENGFVLPRLEVLTHPEVTKLKIERINPFARAVDLRPLLNEHYPGWQDEIKEVAKASPDKLIPGGSVATSMEPSEHVTYYQPTNGLTIAKELPWFYKLFKREIRHIVSRATGDNTMHLGDDLVSSLNVNYLSEGDYETHIDRNPVTALLALETMEYGEGGELVLHQKRNHKTNRAEGVRYSIRPTAGVLYLFDGLTHPHNVTELQRKRPRLVAAGDYYNDVIHEVVDENFNDGIGVLNKKS